MRRPAPAAGQIPGRSATSKPSRRSTPTAVYRSPAFRPPCSGLAGVRRYLGENLAVEENIECRFGEPIVSADRPAVEWWGSWREQGQELTFAGVTVLRFNDDGKVVDHRDYDNHVERRDAPYEGW